jgi:hypothetical protein
MIGRLLLMLSVCIPSGCNARPERLESPDKQTIFSIEKPKQEVAELPELNSDEKALLEKLEKVEKQVFIGKTVSSFIKQSTIKSYKDYYFANEPPGHLNSLALVYSDKVFIEIYAQELKYMKSFSATLEWDLKVYSKEKIREIRLYVYDDMNIEKCIQTIN